MSATLSISPFSNFLIITNILHNYILYAFLFFHSTTSSLLIIIFLTFFLFPLFLCFTPPNKGWQQHETQMLAGNGSFWMEFRVTNALKPVAMRIWTSDPSLRRAPTYCHSLSIWGKVNPYGTLLKTVSDSIWVILNTLSVKLCKALKVSWLFAPANNWGMPWYYHRHLLYDHHASYVRSW